MYNKILSQKLGHKLPLMYRGRGVSNRQYTLYKNTGYIYFHKYCTYMEKYLSYLKKYPASLSGKLKN